MEVPLFYLGIIIVVILFLARELMHEREKNKLMGSNDDGDGDGGKLVKDKLGVTDL